jgi:hypothetical protein
VNAQAVATKPDAGANGALQRKPGAADPAGIILPQIGGYSDMQRLTGRSYASVTRWVCRRQLRPGVYIGNGLFNMSRIRDYLNEDKSFLRVTK